MAIELKATIINMKTLTQDIGGPIVVNAGDAAGSILRIIFTQEAAAQFTPNTKVYLSWLHREEDIKGYNVFTEVVNQEDENFPPTWEIHYPRAMLHEGNVLACIQIVDKVSIATSKNFVIHVLVDPNENLDFIYTDDFTEFQQAVIRLTEVENAAREQLLAQQTEFENMQSTIQQSQQSIEEMLELIDNLRESLSEYTELENYVTQNQIANYITKPEHDNLLLDIAQIHEWGLEEEG